MKDKTTSRTNKRELILHSAIHVIAQRGYYNTRISDIIKHAGIAHGLLYHYFESKEEVLISIFKTSWRQLINDIKEIINDIDDPFAKLGGIIDYSFDMFKRNPDLMKVLIMDIPRIPEFYSKSNQKLYLNYYETITEVIVNGQKSGTFNPNISAEVTAESILGAIDAIIRQYVYNPDFKKGVSLDQASHQIQEMLSQGIMKP